MKWYTVLLRNDGDDEDSLYRGEHTSQDEAVAAATEWVKKEDPDLVDGGDWPVYVNYVLESADKPRLVVNGSGFGAIDPEVRS